MVDHALSVIDKVKDLAQIFLEVSLAQKTSSFLGKHFEQALRSTVFTHSQVFTIFNSKSNCSNSTFTDVQFTLQLAKYM